MKLSERRKQAIYNAVHEEFIRCRIAIARTYPGNAVAEYVDELLYRAMGNAGQAAIEAAEADHRARKRSAK